MLKRIWPQSLMGQMLLAVAIALLLVQGFGAFLVYRAQDEMREAGLVHAAAFKVVGEARRIDAGVSGRSDGEDHGSGEHRRRHRGVPVEITNSSPVADLESRNRDAEHRLAGILENEEIDVTSIEIVRRDVADDPFTLAHYAKRPPRFDRGQDWREASLLVAGVKLAGTDDWLVARVSSRRGEWQPAIPILLQTLLIYAVVVGAIAFILRRITRPLAQLTNRVELFASRQDADGQVDPEGPDDIRRLIEAHNAMESRIAALLDEKDVMLGAIGHDLKTPLAALRVRIETVEDDTERARMAATIEDITRSLDDILSLARVGRPGDPPERTEVSALVAAVVEEYQDMGQPVELAATERLVLDLRPTWLRRALRNLIDNALRYGKAAHVSLVHENGYAAIRVDDDGPGIPDGEIDGMMEPFARGDPSRNSATGGAGLGLALARAIAEQHSGALSLANRPEGGLRAEIRLATQ